MLRGTWSRTSPDDRIKTFKKLAEKYPDKIPVIVERGDKRVPELKKSKFLVPRDLSFSYLIQLIRKQMPSLRPEEAIFIYINDRMAPVGARIEQIYSQHKNSDGFLVAIVTTENVFG